MLQLPTIDPGDEINISASAYVLHCKCPQQALARFAGVFAADSLSAFRGSLAHAIFAKHLLDGPIPEQTFELTCKQAIGGSNLNFKIQNLNLKPSHIKGVIEEVGGLYDRFKKMPVDGFESAEEFLKVQLGGGLTILGRVDAIYRDGDKLRLVDWKTGHIGEVEIQLKFYAALWALEHDELPAEIEAFSVQTGEHEIFTPTADLLNKLLVDLAKMATEVRGAWISGDDLERRAGPWCQYCPLLEECVEGQASQRMLG